MSWKASAYVKSLIQSPNGASITRSEKLILFVLADCHNPHQGYAWPSIDVLAQQALFTPRGVQEVLRRLEGKGLIGTVRGGGRMNTNRYFIAGVETETVNAVRPLQNGKGEPTAQKGRTPGAERVNPRSPEPPLTSIRTDTLAKKPCEPPSEKGKNGRLNPDLRCALLPWMEATWEAKFPGRSWPGLKYPEQAVDQEREYGSEHYRQAWLNFLDDQGGSNGHGHHPVGFVKSMEQELEIGPGGIGSW